MHAYEELDGIALMGASQPPVTAQQKQVAERAKASGANALSVASKLARLKPKRARPGIAAVANKLKAAGSALQKHASSLATAPVASSKKPTATKPAARTSLPASRTAPAAVPRMATRTTQPVARQSAMPARTPARSMARSHLGVLQGVTGDQIFVGLQAYAAALDQFTQLCGVYAAIVVAEDSVTDQTQLDAANAILDQIDAASANFQPDPGSTADIQSSVSAMSGAADLISQGNAWLQSSTGKTVVSTVQNKDGSTDTTYSDGSVTHVDAGGKATTSKPGTASTPGAAPTGPLPTISGVSSTSVQQGDIITITGTNLSGVTKADIGGMQADFSIDSPTQLSVMVPMAAQSGVLHLTPGTATAMIQVAQSQAQQYGAGGGGFGGGGGGGGDSGYGGDSGGGGDSGAQPQYSDDTPVPDSGGGDSDDMAAAADAAIDELLSQSDDGSAAADDSDGGGLDDMATDSVGFKNGDSFDNSLDYDTGAIVWRAGKFWRAVRPVKAPFSSLFQSGEVPGESDAWREDKTVTASTLMGYTPPDSHWYTVATPSAIKAEMDKILREGDTLNGDITSFKTGDSSFSSFRSSWAAFWATYKKFYDDNATGVSGWWDRLWSATGDQVVAYGNQLNDWRSKFQAFDGAVVTEPKMVPVQHREDPTKFNWKPLVIGAVVIVGLFGGGYALSKVGAIAALFGKGR